MSTLKLINIQHPSNPNAAISLDAAGISSKIELTTMPFYGGIPWVNADITISNTYNYMTPGPVSVNTGVTLTVANGATWTVL
jgi:hypothetical protein